MNLEEPTILIGVNRICMSMAMIIQVLLIPLPL